MDYEDSPFFPSAQERVDVTEFTLVRLVLCLCTFLLLQLSTVRGLQWLNLNHSHPTNPASVTRDAVTAVMWQMYESGSEPTINPPQEGFRGAQGGAVRPLLMNYGTSRWRGEG